MQKPSFVWRRHCRAICNLIAGKRVRVYRNLHRNCLSVQYRGRVIAYVDEIKLSDVRFIVSPAGRARVLREQQKTVHAYAEGYVSSWLRRSPRTRCTYNPYRYAAFVVQSNKQTIQKARVAHISSNGIFIR